MVSEAKRIAKNTSIQYVRLIVSIIIGLYSVRLILDALGTEDFGIYGLITGVVTLMSFINTSLTQTSVRFIGVSMGNGDNERVKSSFNNSFWLHIFFGFTIYFFMQIGGNLLFEYYLNIPDGRLEAAKTVFQFVLISLFINVIITPYSALAISHERFSFIAIVSIVDSLLKLGIAIIISNSTADRLILYGVLLSSITLLNFIMYCSYCQINFKSKMRYGSPSFQGIKSMISFASWTVLDVLGVTLTRDGYSIILNRYFGTSMNTVFSLARQIEGQFYTFSSSATETIKPIIMKREGSGQRESMLSLSFTTGKIGFSLLSMIAIPAIIMMPDLLNIWLVSVPEGTILFSRLLIVACMMNQLTQGLVFANQAIGDIKLFSIIVSCCRISALPISWISLHFGAPAHVAIIIFVVCETVGSASRIYVLSRQVNGSVKNFIMTAFIKIIPATLISIIICLFLYEKVNNFTGIILVFLVSVVLFIIFSYLLSFNNLEKQMLRSIVTTRTSRQR